MTDTPYVPDDVSEIPEPVILNPSAVGNPDENPKVWLPPALVRYFDPCQGGPEGWCGGVNGFHQEGCTVDEKRGTETGSSS